MLDFLYVVFLWSFSRLMLRYCVIRLKLVGWWYGLPSLNGYTDEQIAEGFRRLKHRSPFKEYNEE